MIKTETNLEESKKIKELGYDFSFAYNEVGETIGMMPNLFIPLPILEACLPDYERYGSKFTWGGRFSISLKYGTGEDLTIENYTTEHENVYEAFIWAHENYPDETRAKFKEVKKLYEVSK